MAILKINRKRVSCWEIDYGNSKCMLYNPQLDTFICNVETFNRCENNNEVLVAFKSWESVHPLIRIIPVDWDYTMPFGILHSKTPSDKVKRLIKAINMIKANS